MFVKHLRLPIERYFELEGKKRGVGGILFRGNSHSSLNLKRRSLPRQMPADNDGSYAGHFEKRAVVEMKVDYREENIRDNEQTTLVSIDDSPMVS